MEKKNISTSKVKKQNNTKMHKIINIVMPILGIAAVAAGTATLVISTNKKSSGDGEITKEHDIIIDTEETITKNYDVIPNKTKAKKGDEVVFTVTAKTNLTKEPKYLKINKSSYRLIKSEDLTKWEANVTIEAIEKMTVTVVEEAVVEEFTIVFNSNGGSTVESQTVLTGNVATKPQDPIWSDHTFLGWYSDESLTQSYQFNEPVINNLTLYAKWDVTSYTITYHNVVSSEHSNPSSYKSTDATFQLTNAIRFNYTFVGWYDNESLEGTPITEITQGSTGNKNLYAKWSVITYTITYNNVDGATNPNRTKYTTESDTFSLTSATKTDYQFNGWYDNESLSGNPITQITKGSSGNKVLYAKWTEITSTYSVVLLAGDGKFSGEGATSEKRIDIADVAKGTTIGSLLTSKSITITPIDALYKYDGNWTDGINSYTEDSSITNNIIIYPKFSYVAYAPTVENCPSATTIRADENSTIVFTPKESITTKIKYSTTGLDGSWTEINSAKVINVAKGENLYLIGDNSTGLSTGRAYWNIKIIGKCNIGGSVMGLLDKGLNTISAIPINYCFYRLFENSNGINMVSSNFLPATTLTNYCYSNMFNGCTSLTQAPALLATTLANYCYSNMFNGCTSLTSAPQLPTTTLTTNCYEYMFNGCTSLTQAPALLATTLANNCYSNMFNGCTSLTQAPELPATTLCNFCYSNMFIGCTSLTQAPALPAGGVEGDLAMSCYQYMFSGCTSLIQAPELPAKALTNSCYCSMFLGCKSLNTTPILPATILTEHCYECMFDGCTSLVQAPALPAGGTEGNLAANCYNQMFHNCTSLTQAPTLPATTLYNSCYAGMFDGCTSLVQAPALPAGGTEGNLADECYHWMFDGCTSLAQAPALPATTLYQDCYNYMFYGCTSLTSVPALPATTLATGCYSEMFRNCTGLYISAGEPASCSSKGLIMNFETDGCATDMFTGINEGSSFSGTPAINTDYYWYRP